MVGRAVGLTADEFPIAFRADRGSFVELEVWLCPYMVICRWAHEEGWINISLGNGPHTPEQVRAGYHAAWREVSMEEVMREVHGS